MLGISLIGVMPAQPESRSKTRIKQFAMFISHSLRRLLLGNFLKAFKKTCRGTTDGFIGLDSIQKNIERRICRETKADNCEWLRLIFLIGGCSTTRTYDYRKGVGQRRLNKQPMWQLWDGH